MISGAFRQILDGRQIKTDEWNERQLGYDDHHLMAPVSASALKVLKSRQIVGDQM